MRILVTGSAGHLGEALMRTLGRPESAAGAGRATNSSPPHEAMGLDLLPSPFTDIVANITDRSLIARALDGVDAVIHTATLHKPHVSLRSKQEFIDANIRGTLVLLEEAVAAGVRSFVFSSTTSAFGHALQPDVPSPGAALWIDETVTPRARNIYGATKTAAEDLCSLIHQEHGLPCLILRTSRFFPEPDDRPEIRSAYADANAKANEHLYRRVELEDAVDAHLRAADRAPQLGFGRYIVSATTPFTRDDLPDLIRDAPGVVRRLFPDYEVEYDRRGWRMFPSIERVYDNSRARRELEWNPRWTFRYVLDRLRAGGEARSDLARAVGSKGYR